MSFKLTEVSESDFNPECEYLGIARTMAMPQWRNLKQQR